MQPHRCYSRAQQKYQPVWIGRDGLTVPGRRNKLRKSLELSTWWFKELKKVQDTWKMKQRFWGWKYRQGHIIRGLISKARSLDFILRSLEVDKQTWFDQNWHWCLQKNPYALLNKHVFIYLYSTSVLFILYLSSKKIWCS